MQKGIRDFQIPTKTEVDKETLTATYGRFTAEPFERGFGTTVGNSLRRVLLSSLTGAAIVSVKIEGVLHEFSTIPGVTRMRRPSGWRSTSSNPSAEAKPTGFEL